MSKQNPDRSIMPEFGPRAEIKINTPEERTLTNGTRVFLFKDDTLDFLRFDYVINAGSSSQHKPLLAECTVNLLNEGSKKFSGNEITSKIEYFGAHYEPGLSKDKATISLYTLTKNFHEVLPILDEIIFNPTFSNDTLVNYLNRKKQKFISDNDKLRTFAVREFNKKIFGENTPYGSIPIPSDFDNVLSNELIDFHSKTYYSTDNYIVISGNFNELIINDLDKYLGSHIFEDGENVFSSTFSVNQEKGFKVIERKESLQSAIRVGKHLFKKSDPDYPAFYVLNTTLGGYFGSRLMTNLREIKGYTYGINSFIMNFAKADYWSITTMVNAQNTNEAIEEINKEITQIKDFKIKDDELTLVKNYIYGTYLRGFDGALSQAERFRSNFDLGIDFFECKNMLNSMMSVTAEDIQEVANKYLITDEMLYLIVGSYK